MIFVEKSWSLLMPQIPNCQALITRLPYSKKYDPKPIINMSKHIDSRGLIFISMPINVEVPGNGSRLICSLEDSGLFLVANVAWYRDRHVVCTRSKRLTNTWEPIAVFSRSKNYHINREGAMKVKKGFEGREGSFEDDGFLTCIGDFWPIRNDRRDRRFLPAHIVLNAAQLSDLQANDRILDPYGNPGVRDACGIHGWEYIDGGLPSSAREAKKVTHEKENILRNRTNEEENSEGDSGSV